MQKKSRVVGRYEVDRTRAILILHKSKSPFTPSFGSTSPARPNLIHRWLTTPRNGQLLDQVQEGDRCEL